MKRDKPITCKDTGEVFWHYKSYLYGRHWSQFKRRALKHYGKHCSVCGTKQNLNVHHLTYARVGNERLEDVQILCRFHHMTAHKLIGYNVIRKRIRFKWVILVIVIGILWSMWKWEVSK